MDVTNWRQIPPSRREIFSIEDIVGRTNHFLNVNVCSGLAAFALQVYQVPGETSCRWHFYFELAQSFKFRDIQGKEVNIIGLAMWMEREGWRDGDLTVRFMIKERPFYRPLATFVFPLHDPWCPDDVKVTMLTLVNVLRGTTLGPGEDRSNLTRFKFWHLEFVPSEDPEIRGPRDALTQWMICWNKKGYVGWDCCEGIFEDDTVLEDDGLRSGAIDSDAFGNIIGIQFTTEDDIEQERALTVSMRSKRICAGYWITGFERVLFHNNEILPYKMPSVENAPDSTAETETGTEAETQPEDLPTGSPRTAGHGNTENQQAAESHPDSSGEYQIVNLCQMLGIQSQPPSEHADDDHDSSSSSDSSSSYHSDDQVEFYSQETTAEEYRRRFTI
ncbi:hypothetical protein FVEN_g292 [Fusarium venenatum]|uniref:Uncharacterized protein n=1 Tax=Fusarium venenatum TaxID=56646 RepID=A0A2L2T0X1_9HYPO|nr:uncharacterized protein FVRRES_07604 [Fusarium venenatum]KAG8362037.1 hypothetical protein FVEN_g292 [Fusarium venenatum]CEI63168.1 unnamed protein product [Fusarium venenatum]